MSGNSVIFNPCPHGKQLDQLECSAYAYVVFPLSLVLWTPLISKGTYVINLILAHI